MSAKFANFVNVFGNIFAEFPRYDYNEAICKL